MSEDADEADDEAFKETFKLRHMALRNALYHLARRRWLDGINRLCNFLVILGGTGAAVELTRADAKFGFALGASIATIGALQLVFDFSGRARQHDILQRRYFDLMADMECVLEPTKDGCAKWRAEITRSAADEPPTMRALDAIADNQATFALLGGDGPRLKVTWWQSLTRHLIAHNGGQFKDMSGEVAA